MNKLIITLTIALLAIPALFGSAAEAGHRGRGFHSVVHHLAAIERAKRANDRYERQQAYRAAKIRAQRQAYAAKQAAKAAAAANRAKAKAAAVAQAQMQAEAEAEREVARNDAESQNSSITTSEGDVAQVADATKTVAAAEDIGCKQFFPSVGMTLTVPCE